MLLGACAWAAQLPNVRQGSLWGLTAIDWYWIAILTAVLHQIYVWLCWRTELNEKGLTRVLGGHAFQAFAVGFALIGLSRVLTVFVLAFANQDSLTFDPLWIRSRPALRSAPLSRTRAADHGRAPSKSRTQRLRAARSSSATRRACATASSATSRASPE